VEAELCRDTIVEPRAAPGPVQSQHCAA
jgi:hypothetical protein